MLGFHEYYQLSQSSDADERGHAARVAARAYLEHDGPMDEQAALYAAVLSFLDDPSVKVRAALAYELLHAPNAPRPVMFSLAQDEPIISAAVAQYSPVLLESDLTALIKFNDRGVVLAVLDREQLSPTICGQIFDLGDKEYDRSLLLRDDDFFKADRLIELADRWCDDPDFRALLLKRADLPIAARYLLIERISDDLAEMHLAKGNMQPKRLKRMMRDMLDSATTRLVNGAPHPEHMDYVEALFASNRLTPRLMIHALVNGRLLFFATAAAVLSELSIEKVIGQLETGTRRSLHALFTRCGFRDGLGNLMTRLCLLARAHDLHADVAARHFVVSQIIDSLIEEFGGQIPEDLDTVFAYLNEQNVALAREAARGVMASFIAENELDKLLPQAPLRDELRALTAA